MNYAIRRTIELVVAVLGAAIAGLSLWIAYDTVAHAPGGANLFLWMVGYLITFVALALTVFVLRLAIPKLRIEGGRIIGKKGLLAFGILYGVTVLARLFTR